MESTIPVVDLHQFTKGDAEQRKSFINALGEAYHNVGFVAVVNHGISKDLVDSFYENAYTFFKKDLAIKSKYEIEGLAGQRGYTSFGKEKAKHSETPDLKEFFQYGQEVSDNHPLKSEYPDNVHVSELPSFTEKGLELYKSFEECGSELLKAIALFLGLDENYFQTHITDGNSILRAIHYPPITSEPKSAVRAEQHEDINLITLLVGASSEGLELLNMKDEWQAINAGPGQIVVNVGDMLQRLTNNYLKSTTHRVVNPPKEKWGNPRLSIPFFLHPKGGMDLTCLESCVTEERPLAFESITAGEYLDQRLREIGLKK